MFRGVSMTPVLLLVRLLASAAKKNKAKIFWGPPSMLVLLTSLFMQHYLAPFIGPHKMCISRSNVVIFQIIGLQ